MIKVIFIVIIIIIIEIMIRLSDILMEGLISQVGQSQSIGI